MQNLMGAIDTGLAMQVGSQLRTQRARVLFEFGGQQGRLPGGELFGHGDLLKQVMLGPMRGVGVDVGQCDRQRKSPWQGCQGLGLGGAVGVRTLIFGAYANTTTLIRLARSARSVPKILERRLAT
jgi:hypothetical protein